MGFESMPPMGGQNTSEKESKKVENVDKYEKEKIESTLKDAKRLVTIMENYLEMVKFCDEQGIKIKNRTKLDNIRYEGAPAGPGSDLGKIESLFQSGQKEIGSNLTKDQIDGIYYDRILPKIEGVKFSEFSSAESIKDPALADLYRNASDAGKTSTYHKLDDIKKTAERISQSLFDLGVTKLSPESELGQAYLSSKNVVSHYRDIGQAESAMLRVAKLIQESDGFEEASKAWNESKG